MSQTVESTDWVAIRSNVLSYPQAASVDPTRGSNRPSVMRWAERATATASAITAGTSCQADGARFARERAESGSNRVRCVATAPISATARSMAASAPGAGSTTRISMSAAIDVNATARSADTVTASTTS